MCSYWVKKIAFKGQIRLGPGGVYLFCCTSFCYCFQLTLPSLFLFFFFFPSFLICFLSSFLISHLHSFPYFFKKCIYFIYLFLAAFGLHCCAQAFSSCDEWRLLFVVVCGLLIAVASLVVEHRLQVHGLQYLWHMGSVVVARRLQSTGSVVVAHGLSCSAARGIFLDQGLNPCPLHWQVDS